MKELIEAYEAYIALMGEELSELMPLAANRGWSSKRIKIGEKARKRITEAKKAIDVS